MTSPTTHSSTNTVKKTKQKTNLLGSSISSMYDISLDFGLFCAASSNLLFSKICLSKITQSVLLPLPALVQPLSPMLFSIYHTPNSRYLPRNEDALLNSFTDDRPTDDRFLLFREDKSQDIPLPNGRSYFPSQVSLTKCHCKWQSQQ